MPSKKTSELDTLDASKYLPFGLKLNSKLSSVSTHTERSIKHIGKIRQNCSAKRFKKCEGNSKLKSNNVTFIYFLNSKKKCEKMLLSYNNEFLLESIVFLACPAVLRMSMTQGKPLKITHSQTIVVSRFTKRNIDLMQKVYMNLFHLLAIYFTKSVFFFFINRD